MTNSTSQSEAATPTAAEFMGFIQTIQNQCSDLYDHVKYLQAQHRFITLEKRETIIDNLCKLAENLFSNVQQTAKDVESNNNKVTNNTEQALTIIKTTSIQSSSENKRYDYEIIRQARNNHRIYKCHKKHKQNVLGHKCHSCGTTETPEWRRGPDGARTLCNACGLHYAKLVRKGAIGAQTTNYMLLDQGQRDHNGELVNTHAKPTFPENYPFILIDPKYGFNRNLESANRIEASSSGTSHNTRKEFKIISNYTPSIKNEQESIDMDSSQHTTTTPLRIYQWKQQ
ncbi:hypothetical protein G6F70_007105 [Rhizopus microsporus]|nr:hypothetical protein G6F70_007105 [Rhizopus microsporus]KAG1208748.1 hypothetical protein G6F69_006955 [Rhizopus microsporus]KAG1269172.1 hypothetical protein G6F68_000512 [Rhizopus microsporus]